MLIKLLAVGIGGFLGAVARYLTSIGLAGATRASGFPVATFAVNVVGCFALGWLMVWLDGRDGLSKEVRLAATVGFFGSFTTYSTFSYETLVAARAGQVVVAALNVTLHIVFGLFAVWCGHALARSQLA